MINCGEKLTMNSTGRSCYMVTFILLGFTVFATLGGLLTQSEASDKIAVIAIDPDLMGGVKFYLNSPRILMEINWYKNNGYRIASVQGTVDGITQALLNSNVKTITFVGEGGLRRPDGKPVSCLAGLGAKGWRAKIRMALIQRYRQNNVPLNEAIKRGTKESQNFNLERVVNYSCYSLFDTSIAELFVKPGGTYYGSSVLYSGNPLSFVYFWFTDKMQFILEPYKVPVVPQRQSNPLAGILGSWEFGRNQKDYIGTVILTSKIGKNGAYVIDGYSHPNESYWKIEEPNTIIFLHERGKVTTRFHRKRPNYWEGAFIHPKDRPNRKPVTHYLRRK